MSKATHPAISSSLQLVLAAALFFFSGASSLIYEVVWVKVLSLQFGSSAWSIATVIASFMAGLGAGGAWAGRRADRSTRPLLAYSAIELGIALYGLASIFLLENVSGLLYPLYGLVDGQFGLFVLAQFLLSFLMLALPTFLMGASLPLLIVAVSRQGAFARQVALLYGVNTLGAAAGTALAGTFLLPTLGISNTVWVAVGLGVLVAAGGLLLGRSAGRRQIAEEPGAAAEPAPVSPLLLAVMAVAGGLGIIYQIAWTRLLVPVVGSSTYAFTVILTTVLLGIGVGALLAALPFVKRRSDWSVVGVALGVSSVTALAGLAAVNGLPQLFTALAQGTGGSTWLLFGAQGVLAASIVWCPAAAWGPPCLWALPSGTIGPVRRAGPWASSTRPIPVGRSPVRCWPALCSCRGWAPAARCGWPRFWALP